LIYIKLYDKDKNDDDFRDLGKRIGPGIPKQILQIAARFIWLVWIIEVSLPTQVHWSRQELKIGCY